MQLPRLLLALSLYSSILGPTRAAETGIRPWSPALQSEVVHWNTPFTATYRTDGGVLVFVAAEHVFTPVNSTVSAIAAAFESANPAIVIVEGFPTSMGESPAPLVDDAKQRGKPGASSYANGEGMFAASLAIAHNIPFVGGEPSYAQQVAALVRKGFTQPDITFNFLLGNLGQSKRSGQLSPTGANFDQVYEDAARAAARIMRGQPMPYADFSARYRELFGIDARTDQMLGERNDPGTSTVVAAIGQADMTGRDEHLLATIRQALESRKRVLVVYGNAHWTTLSAALQAELGKPTIK